MKTKLSFGLSYDDMQTRIVSSPAKAIHMIKPIANSYGTARRVEEPERRHAGQLQAVVEVIIIDGVPPVVVAVLRHEGSGGYRRWGLSPWGLSPWELSP